MGVNQDGAPWAQPPEGMCSYQGGIASAKASCFQGLWLGTATAIHLRLRGDKTFGMGLNYDKESGGQWIQSSMNDILEACMFVGYRLDTMLGSAQISSAGNIRDERSEAKSGKC